MTFRWAVVGLFALTAGWAVCEQVSTGEIAEDTAQNISEQIDRILQREYQQLGIVPCSVCSDEVFLRRVTLDLAGRIPTRQEIHQFRQNPDRKRKVDELIASNDFSATIAESWTAVFLGRSIEDGIDRESFRDWLYQSLRENLTYDEIAKKMIAARGRSSLDGHVNFLLRYQDEPAMRVARLFLGVRLDCARCHDHPFDRWTQVDFEHFSRFYRGLRIRELPGADHEVFDELAETRRVQKAELPVFFTGAKPRTAVWRDELAYFTVRSRPFARVFANRLWHQLVGLGIVDPPDDFHAENQPSSRELLEKLADAALESKFDFRHMVRTICYTQAYQRAGQTNAISEAIRLFAVGIRKPLTPEQSFDSYRTALSMPADRQSRQDFLQQVAESSGADASGSWNYTETVQALMNRLTMPLVIPRGSLDELFLRILTRLPTDAERAICAGKPLEDIAFALLHSNEFFFRP